MCIYQVLTTVVNRTKSNSTANVAYSVFQSTDMYSPAQGCYNNIVVFNYNHITSAHALHYSSCSISYTPSTISFVHLHIWLLDLNCEYTGYRENVSVRTTQCFYSSILEIHLELSNIYYLQENLYNLSANES